MSGEADVITHALAAATVVKVLVDLVKMAVKPPAWVVAGLALGAGVGAVLLFMVAGGVALSPQLAATAVLAGILAAGSAVLSTDLQKRAAGPREPDRAPGS